MVADIPLTLRKISIFLEKDIVKYNISDRNKIAGIDSSWVNKEDRLENGDPGRTHGEI